MLMPKRTKYRKMMKGRMTGQSLPRLRPSPSANMDCRRSSRLGSPAARSRPPVDPSPTT